MSRAMHISHNEKMGYLTDLENIAKEVGDQLVNQKYANVSDTHDYKGHESSTVDAFARERMQAVIDLYLPRFEGIIRTELNPFKKTMIEEGRTSPLVLIIDEIEGTTNFKRCFASSYHYYTQSIISMALSLTEKLEDIIIGVAYSLDQREIFSAVRMEKEFMAFHNRRRILPNASAETYGDSKNRVVVAGYSNSHRLQKGQLEQLIYDSGLKTYDGCRASGFDVINIIRNQTDAYIDLRAMWSTKDTHGREKEAMLQVYDIAGVVPVAEGNGLIVTDAEGNPWQDYNLEDAVSLVIARPCIHEQIIKSIKPLVDEWKVRPSV